MKIIPENSISQAIPLKNPGAETKVNSSFEDILNNKIEDLNISKTGTDPSLSVNRTADILLIPPIEENEVISRLEKFLDTLEEYTEKLGNSDFTPKDISLLISKLESEKEDLSVLSESFTQDSELKGLLDDALIRTTAEVIKFNRGDYL